MAAVRGLRVYVESEGDSGPREPGAEAAKEAEREEEPMEVEEGEIEPEKLDAISVRRTLKDLIPDTSRRYENKAGTFITGIDVTSKEAVDRKEQRAKRFHFRAESNLTQQAEVLDRELLKQAIPKVRLEALHVMGVDEMSTEEIFTYFKEYPPSSIEWIDDSSCNVVWLDDVTAARALMNMSVAAEPSVSTRRKSSPDSPKHDSSQGKAEEEQEEEDGELEEKPQVEREEVQCEAGADSVPDALPLDEQDAVLQNDLRPAVKSLRGNKLQVRFATKDDHKELGAARRSQYYMKYGNPNYGGMKGILSNSWKRRYHARRIQRDVLKKKSFSDDDDEALESGYKHRHSGLGNVPEEPIQEEDEDEDEQDMEADDRVVVEYRDEARPGCYASSRDSDSDSDSDEMDYDLELKMISMPSPKKSLKMTMYADEVEAQLKNIRNSIKPEASVTVVTRNIRNRIGTRLSAEKISDVRLLLEDKRQLAERRQPPGAGSSCGTGVRQRLGKRPHSPHIVSSAVTAGNSSIARREPQTDVHSRLGVPRALEPRGPPSDRSKKPGSLWSRLGKAPSKREKSPSKEEEEEEKPLSKEKEKPVAEAGEGEGEPEGEGAAERGEEKDDDTELQRAWGALIREKERSRKKSRLDNLPSLQIEISRESSTSDSES
ncbi:nuclear cap-binding protein subunit 3 [Callorhinchus milii]|uniref:Nuclear cap-binding protein subunit 3 n=1 Tax=Callorhinchus milii TaxID=7868 RepID=V9KK13_CALMI|nr:nuclear cap-binding protein subunit 3 [Callorhinchus milii]